MDLEKLNTTQIILLTLLVSFVTSIATGIVTVTLLDQAPPGVTHTISKVVEKTVEKVVPEKSQGAAVVKTIIVKEDDLISKAVESNKKSLVEVFVEGKVNEEGGLTENHFVSTGFIASADGFVVTDSALVSGRGKYKVKIYNGDELDIEVVMQDEEKGIAILKIISEEEQTFPSIVFANSDDISLGQTVVLLRGIDNTTVLTGIVSSFDIKSYIRNIISENPDDKEITTEEIKYRSAINTNASINLAGSGSLLLNTDGDTIGMNLVRESVSYAIPSNLIVDTVASIEKTESESSSVDEVTTS